MLGNIIGIVENEVQLKLAIDVNQFENLINVHVIMEDGERKIVGEIIDIKDNIAYINLLGEIVNDKFVFGVIVKPSFSSVVKLISKEKIPMIIGIENYQENRDIYIGTSPIYPGIKVGANINQFFSNHFAVLGSTGSGKSCGVARIIQNIFERKIMYHIVLVYLFLMLMVNITMLLKTSVVVVMRYHLNLLLLTYTLVKQKF